MDESPPLFQQNPLQESGQDCSAILEHLSNLPTNRRQALLYYSSSRIRTAIRYALDRDLVQEDTVDVNWERHIKAEIDSVACLIGSMSLTQPPDSQPLKLPSTVREASRVMMENGLSNYTRLGNLLTTPYPDEEASIQQYLNAWWRQTNVDTPLTTAAVLLGIFFRQEKVFDHPMISSTADEMGTRFNTTAMTDEELRLARKLAKETIDLMDQELRDSKTHLAVLDDKLEALTSLRADLLAGQGATEEYMEDEAMVLL